MFFSRLKRKSDKAPPGESRLPFPPRGAGPAARPKQRSHPLAGRRGPPQRPWGPRGRQQRGFLELARVLESRVAARGQLSALLLAASLSAAGRTEFWGAPQHCGTSWLSDVYTMPALRQAKEKKMWQGIFFSFVLLFVVVWGFFFFLSTHTPPLPRGSQELFFASKYYCNNYFSFDIVVKEVQRGLSAKPETPPEQAPGHTRGIHRARGCCGDRMNLKGGQGDKKVNNKTSKQNILLLRSET